MPGIVKVGPLSTAQGSRTSIMWMSVAAALCLPSAASGADWTVNASVTGEFQYDDNIDLDTDDQNEGDTFGFSTRPNVGVTASTPRLKLGVNAGLNYTVFTDRSDLNSFDQSVNGTAAYKLERSQFSAAGNFSRATTRTTEDEDTGRDFTDARRIGLSGSGSWAYTLSERNSIGVRGGGSRVTYDTDSLDDFFTYSGGTFFRHVLTEKDSLELSGNYTRFETTSGLKDDSDIYAGNVSWTHIFDPKIQVTSRIGANHVRSEADQQIGSTVISTKEDNTGVQGGITLTLSSEQSKLDATFERGIFPSGSGRVEERNVFRLGYNYRATPVVTLDVTTTYIDQSSVGDNDTDDRNFFFVEPGVSWQFLPDWFVRAAYRLRTQKFDDEDSRAYSNGVRAAVTWRMPVRRLGSSQ